jgi:hypothetical protein
LSKIKQFTTEVGKQITIYDDLFTLSERQKYYDAAFQSNFVIGWADGSINENQPYKFLHSVYSGEDVKKLGIVDAIRKSAAAQELEGFKPAKAILNLSTMSCSYFVHAHPEQKVMLYYVNLEWKDGWHGETVFYDESCKEIIFTNAYTPGRLCVFDATIPHALRPPSRLGPDYRFTLALIMDKC